ncbi:Ig-like domain-containing protein, partial [bacterium]|nr:Ig-like domain-containing protein [bacterium]
PHFNGSDLFVYSASDSAGGTASATVNITVTPVEDVPIATDDVYFMEEFSTLEVAVPGVLGNDLEPDGDPLNAVLVSGPSNGTLSLNTDGSFSYTADQGFLGTDSFGYAISDGKAGSDTGLVAVTVNPLQITHEETVTGSASESAVASTDGVLTAVNGGLYLAAISAKPLPQVTQVVGLGLTWTRIQAQCSGRSNTGVEVWMAQGLPATDGAVTATLSSSVKNAVINVSRYSGVDRENPIQTIVSGNTNGVVGACFGGGDTDAYSFNIASTFDGSVLYGAVALRERLHTPGNDFQERVELHQGGGGSGAGLAVVDKAVESVAATTVSGSFTSRVDWAFVGLEIKSGSSGGGVPQYSLTFNTTGLGAVVLNPTGGTYPAGTEVELTAVPDSGWSFAGWGGDANGVDTTLTLIMSEAKNVSATFNEIPPQQFTLTVTTLGQGSVYASPQGPNYIEGTEVALTARPDSGWAFVGWGGDTIGSANPLTVSMDSSITVLATFEENAAPVAGDDVFDVFEDDTLLVDAPGVLANDTDSDGDSLVVSISSDPTHGSLTLGSDGSLSYIPAADSNGVIQLSYSLNDNRGGRNTGQITVTVRAVNDPPVALDDSYQITEDDTLDVVAPGILLNDRDIDGDALAIVLDSEPSHGSLNFNIDGSFRFIPNADFSGVDSFVYQISDPSGEISSGMVTIQINERNDVPVARNDAFTLNEDDSLTVASPGVLANDVDADGDTLNAVLQVGPTRGSVSLSSGGSFVYTPAGDFHGADTFSYTVQDNHGGSASASVMLTINAIPDAPQTTDDVYFVEEFSPLDVIAPGVLANDTDADGDSLTVSVVTSPSNGALTLNPDGSFSYSGNPGFLGTDSFVYAASDGLEPAVTGRVTITVNPRVATHEETVGGSASKSTTISTSEFLTAMNGHLYLAAISAKPFREVVSVSGLGLNWTRVRSQCAGRNNTGVEVWAAQGLPSGDGGVTASFSSAPTNSALAVSRYSGVDPTDALRTIVSGNTNGSNGGCAGGADSDSYRFEINDTAGGSIVYGAVALRNKTHNPGEGFTERIELSQGTGGSGAGLAISDRATEAGVTNVLNGSLSRKVDWAAIGIEIKSSSTGGVVPTFDLTLESQGSGTVILSPATGPYQIGTEVTLTAQPASGWTFTAWTGDLISEANPSTITMNDNKTVGAIFSEIPPQQFTLTVSLSGQGSVQSSPPGDQHIEGQQVTITAAPDSGWIFTGWAGDASGLDNPLVFIMDANKNVLANFVQNAAPIALNDDYQISEDDTLIVPAPGLLSNDSDSDGDSLTVAVVNGPDLGALNLSLDGGFSYIPAPDSNGVVTFVYSANDGKGGFGFGTVSVTVIPVNDPPTAAQDNFHTQEDDTLAVAAPGVLANDVDPDRDSLVATLKSGPSSGTLAFNADGSFIYTPNSEFHGTDSFSYHVSDGSGGTSTAIVSLSIAIQNDPPVALDDTYSVQEDEALTVLPPGVLSNDQDPDGDSLAVVVSSGPSNGQLTLSLDGSFIYTPAPHFSGQDTYTYILNDNLGGTDIGTVTIAVNPIQDIPVASDDFYNVSTGVSLSLPAPGVLTNDS